MKTSNLFFYFIQLPIMILLLPCVIGGSLWDFIVDDRLQKITDRLIEKERKLSLKRKREARKK